MAETEQPSDPPAPFAPSEKRALTTNGKLAIASLVCGIVALAYPACITGPIGSVAAIVMGILGIRSEKRGSAIAGIVLGGLAIAIFALLAYLEIQNRKAVNDLMEQLNR